MRRAVLTELGIAVYEDGRPLESFPFADPVEGYAAARGGGPLPDGLLAALEGAGMVEVSDAHLQDALGKESVESRVMGDEERAGLQESKPALLAESGLARDEADARARLRDFALELSSSRVTEASASPDMHVIQAIGALDDVDRAENVLGARLREWYGLHFPELDSLADGIPGYARVAAAGRRGSLSESAFEAAGFAGPRVEMLALACGRSRGGEISDENLALARALAGAVLELHGLRKRIEEGIEGQMRAVAPNLSAILGTPVGARAIAKAGSLARLATMPASTIQVIGAERALFRSIKTGSRPPKHGLLFQHPLVHAAPRWQRGKIARAIAAKAAIAARVDVHGGGINKTLLEKLNVRVGEIDSRYRDPPPPRPAAEAERAGGPGRRDAGRPGRGEGQRGGRGPREGGAGRQYGGRGPREGGGGRRAGRDGGGGRYGGGAREGGGGRQYGGRGPREGGAGRRGAGPRAGGPGRRDGGGRSPGGRQRGEGDGRGGGRRAGRDAGGRPGGRDGRRGPGPGRKKQKRRRFA